MDPEFLAPRLEDREAIYIAAWIFIGVARGITDVRRMVILGDVVSILWDSETE